MNIICTVDIQKTIDYTLVIGMVLTLDLVLECRDNNLMKKIENKTGGQGCCRSAVSKKTM